MCPDAAADLLSPQHLTGGSFYAVIASESFSLRCRSRRRVRQQLVHADVSFHARYTHTRTGAGHGYQNVSIVVNAQGLGSQAYKPSPLTVAIGTTVRWTNDD